MPHAADTLSLLADIGGTNTRLALADGQEILPRTVRRYRNADHADLESVIRRYVADEDGVDTRAACVAVAGPVRDGRARMTNLDWTIDEDALARATGAERVAILNDLQAQGHALGHIDPGNLRQILPFPAAAPEAARLVIGIGTGFNAAPVHVAPGGRLVAPSEAGHATLPVADETDLRLARYLAREHGFAAIEDVLSGRGLERLYAWLSEEAGAAARLDAAAIMTACSDESDPRAVEAAQVFVRILGSVAGDLALTHLPFGGIYLAGGVARVFAPYLERFGFAKAFRDKGRFETFMSNFGVASIEDDFAALTGCAAYLGS